MKRLTHELLLSILKYNPDTGIFTRNGEAVGTNNGHGYLRITIQKKSIFCHRLAWFYMYGKWPVNQIDHINRIRTDNRFSNLRDVTAKVNQRNKSVPVDHPSGLLGVTWCDKKRKWMARITNDGKGVLLGQFDYMYEAMIARKAAEKVLEF